MPMRPRSGRRLATRHRKSWSSSSRVGALNGMDLAALRIDARHHVLDGAVLAGRVHRLENDQHRPAVLRVEPLLQLGEPLDAVRQHRLGLVLVDVETAVSAGSKSASRKLSGLSMRKRLSDFVEFHAASSRRGRLSKRSAQRRLVEKRSTKRGIIGSRSARQAHDHGRRRVRAASRAPDARGCARAARGGLPRLHRASSARSSRPASDAVPAGIGLESPASSPVSSAPRAARWRRDRPCRRRRRRDRACRPGK